MRENDAVKKRLVMAIHGLVKNAKILADAERILRRRAGRQRKVRRQTVHNREKP